MKGEVYMLEGCAMRVLYPDVHEALRRLLRRLGFAVRKSESGCCGALHAHSGFLDDARNLADRLVESMADEIPVIVDSAGCGSFMKEYGLLSEAPSPRMDRVADLPRRSPKESTRAKGLGVGNFVARVFDASEFLFQNGLIELLKTSPGIPATATYHDACHLAHGQRIKDAPRDLLQNVPRLTLVELQEADMCCGSAGVYNLTQPGYARRLLDRKWANVIASSAEILATGNPGCHSWIQQASDEHGRPVRVMHTLDLGVLV